MGAVARSAQLARHSRCALRSLLLSAVQLMSVALGAAQISHKREKCCTGVLLLGGVLYRALRLCWQSLNHAARRARTIQARMETAASFTEWQSLASELDAIRDHSKQGGRTRDGKNDLYDEKLLAAKVAELEGLRAVGNVEELMFSIRSDLYRDFGNITNRCALARCWALGLPKRLERATLTQFKRYIIADFHRTRSSRCSLAHRTVAARRAVARLLPRQHDWHLGSSCSHIHQGCSFSMVVPLKVLVMTCRNIHHQYHILPKPIRHYIHTVEACLEDISKAQGTLDPQTKLSFFQETRHAFGRTALVLSGGGSLGAFHLVRAHTAAVAHTQTLCLQNAPSSPCRRPSSDHALAYSQCTSQLRLSSLRSSPSCSRSGCCCQYLYSCRNSRFAPEAKHCRRQHSNQLARCWWRSCSSGSVLCCLLLETIPYLDCRRDVQGIVRGLMEQNLLPRIIAGSSVGSIVAALTAVHTDEELRTMYSNMQTFNLSFFVNNSPVQALFHLMRKGSLQGAQCAAGSHGCAHTGIHLRVLWSCMNVKRLPHGIVCQAPFRAKSCMNAA